MKWVLVATIILTLASIVLVYFDYDRRLRLRMTSLQSLISAYSLKPKTKGRVVAVINTENGVDETMLKCILDQSVRLHDITVQTKRPDLIPREMLSVLSVHEPGTDILREADNTTIVMYLINGREYPYDYVESYVESLTN